MSHDRRSIAIELRKSGHSIKSISKEVRAAQSTVSIWVRDINLSEQQIMSLRANTHSPETIEKRRRSRLKSELEKRTLIKDTAKNDITLISKRELWLMGIALYWAEGGKTKSFVNFSNGDPRMIILFIKFLTEVCNVDKARIRCYIHIHEHLDTLVAEKYWQSVTEIPAEQFYKTYNKPNISSKGARNSLPYGVCDVYILDFKLMLKIKGWIEGIYESSLKLI